MKLYSPAGQLMVWSTGGHQGQGWMNRTIPLQSPEEFQVKSGQAPSSLEMFHGPATACPAPWETPTLLALFALGIC